MESITLVYNTLMIMIGAVLLCLILRAQSPEEKAGAKGGLIVLCICWLLYGIVASWQSEQPNGWAISESKLKTGVIYHVAERLTEAKDTRGALLLVEPVRVDVMTLERIPTDVPKMYWVSGVNTEYFVPIREGGDMCFAPYPLKPNHSVTNETKSVTQKSSNILR